MSVGLINFINIVIALAPLTGQCRLGISSSVELITTYRYPTSPGRELDDYTEARSKPLSKRLYRSSTHEAGR